MKTLLTVAWVCVCGQTGTLPEKEFKLSMTCMHAAERLAKHYERCPHLQWAQISCVKDGEAIFRWTWGWRAEP